MYFKSHRLATKFDEGGGRLHLPILVYTGVRAPSPIRLNDAPKAQSSMMKRTKEGLGLHLLGNEAYQDW
jgi:hypothetical protein